MRGSHLANRVAGLETENREQSIYCVAAGDECEAAEINRVLRDAPTPCRPADLVVILRGLIGPQAPARMVSMRSTAA